MGPWIRVAGALLVRPWLWATAVAQVVRLLPRGWWRRWPPRPIPDRHYLEFRLLTQYGDARHPPEPVDVVTYLEWRRQWARADL